MEPARLANAFDISVRSTLGGFFRDTGFERDSALGVFAQLVLTEDTALQNLNEYLGENVPQGAMPSRTVTREILARRSFLNTLRRTRQEVQNEIFGDGEEHAAEVRKLLRPSLRGDQTDRARRKERRSDFATRIRRDFPVASQTLRPGTG